MHVNLALMAGTDEQSLGGPEDCSNIQPMKNSVSGSCVATSCSTVLRTGVCTNISTENEEAGR